MDERGEAQEENRIESEEETKQEERKMRKDEGKLLGQERWSREGG